MFSLLSSVEIQDFGSSRGNCTAVLLGILACMRKDLSSRILNDFNICLFGQRLMMKELQDEPLQLRYLSTFLLDIFKMHVFQYFNAGL